MNQEHRSGDRRNKDGAVWTDKRHADRRVSPAVGQFAIQDAAKLRQINKELVVALQKMVRYHDDLVAAGYGVSEDADHARVAIANAGTI